MGCDIHIVLECKWGDKWVGTQLGYLSKKALDYTWEKYWEDDSVTAVKYDKPKYVKYLIGRRNYGFFNSLCGVRGQGSEFGYTDRGLPDDASDMSEMLLSEDDPDLHSHSWLTIRELVPCLAAHWGTEGKKPEEYVFERMASPDGNLYLATELVDEEINAENADEWRLVFAFDN
jgi:hypothetical protein